MSYAEPEFEGRKEQKSSKGFLGCKGILRAVPRSASRTSLGDEIKINLETKRAADLASLSDLLKEVYKQTRDSRPITDFDRLHVRWNAASTDAETGKPAADVAAARERIKDEYQFLQRLEFPQERLAAELGKLFDWNADVPDLAANRDRMDDWRSALAYLSTNLRRFATQGQPAELELRWADGDCEIHRTGEQDDSHLLLSDELREAVRYGGRFSFADESAVVGALLSALSEMRLSVPDFVDADDGSDERRTWRWQDPRKVRSEAGQLPQAMRGGRDFTPQELAAWRWQSEAESSPDYAHLVDSLLGDALEKDHRDAEMGNHHPTAVEDLLSTLASRAEVPRPVVEQLLFAKLIDDAPRADAAAESRAALAKIAEFIW